MNRPGCFENQARVGIVEKAGDLRIALRAAAPASTPMRTAGDSSRIAFIHAAVLPEPARPITAACRR